MSSTQRFSPSSTPTLVSTHVRVAAHALAAIAILSATPSRGAAQEEAPNAPRAVPTPREAAESVVESEPTQGAAERARRSSEEIPAELERLIEREPTASEVVERAQIHLGLRMDDLRGIGERARNRSLLPLFAVGGRMGRTDYQRGSVQQPNPVVTDEDSQTSEMVGNVGVLWDLRDLSFNAAEVDVYSVIDMRRRIVTEISRVYLARRLLQIDLYTEPGDLRNRLVLEARIAEYTSVLDSMTGGWFQDRLDELVPGTSSR